MLHKILVPLDGSELAERALIAAAALAHPNTAKLLLVRAAMSHTLAGVDGQERRVGAIQEAEAYLAGVRADLVERGLIVDTVAPYGPPADCIADQARLQSADLILMSTHGRTGPARLLFGSVAEAVVARSSVPVMLERAWRPLVHAPRLGQGSSVLLLLDGSPFAESAIAAAARLALGLGSRLDLAQVIGTQADVHQADVYLGSVRARVAGTWPGVPVATNVRFGDDAAAEIDRLLAETRPALAVMATHGRTGLRRSLLGSVAGHVLRHASAPLVLVRPTTADDLATEGIAAAPVEATRSS